MPLDPSMFGMGGPGGPGGAPPGMDPMMGGGNPMAGPALSALDQLSPKSPNPTASMQKIEEALDLAYKLVSTVISQAQMTNPKVAKDGHQIARSLLNMKSELRKDSSPGIPPDLMLGMGMAGSPNPMGPQTTPGGMGGGGGAM